MKMNKESLQNRNEKGMVEVMKENSNSKTLFSKDCSLGSFRPV